MYFLGDPDQESSADTITGSIVVAEAKTEGDMQDFVRESLNSAYIQKYWISFDMMYRGQTAEPV